jgi:two-component system, LytTR family, response regulator
MAMRRLRTAEGATPGGVDAAVEQVLRTIGTKRDWPARFLVRRGRQMRFVRAETIDWLDAQGNYAQLHIGGRTHLLRETMTAMEAKLNPALFVRIHRSVIINIDRVATIEPHVHGEYEITMQDGARMTTSAAHSARLRGMLRE